MLSDMVRKQTRSDYQVLSSAMGPTEFNTCTAPHHGDGARAAVDDALQRAGASVEVKGQVEVQHVVEHLQGHTATRGVAVQVAF
jgi:hypothetical protein